MISVLVNVIADAIIIPLGAADPLGLLIAQTFMVAIVYLMLLVFSLMITVSEWKHIRATNFKKIFYAFTFPIYLFSFVPAAFVAIFKKVEWKQTVHGSGEDGNQTK
jgi:CDP-diglyceride synthetase